MSNSTVTLRIQELAEAKGLTLEELSQVSGVSVQDIQTYATAPIKLTEEMAYKLRDIATKLNIPVVELVKPIAKKEAFKLNIIERLKQNRLTLAQLSERSGIHQDILAFYSTQPISKQKLAESLHQTHLIKICEVLGCRFEDLQVTADLPVTKLRFEAFTDERGLTLKDISLLTGYSQELIDLVATQPLDISNNSSELKATEDGGEGRNVICQVTGLGCPSN